VSFVILLVIDTRVLPSMDWRASIYVTSFKYETHVNFLKALSLRSSKDRHVQKKKFSASCHYLHVSFAILLVIDTRVLPSIDWRASVYVTSFKYATHVNFLKALSLRSSKDQARAHRRAHSSICRIVPHRCAESSRTAVLSCNCNSNCTGPPSLPARTVCSHSPPQRR
jgi:hypothetical protein